jgi:hypothetical protein
MVLAAYLQRQRGGDEFLLVAPMKGRSYDEIFRLIASINFSPRSNRNRQTLPSELVYRVMQYLVIKRVSSEMVRALECSSHDRIYPLQRCLIDDDTSWWLSAMGTMPQGRGRQWVQFALGSTLRRLSTVQIKIPPLPQGPLSVREFLVQAFSIDRGWHQVSPTFVVANRAGWQMFHLTELVDVDEVRIVCLSNQISALIHDLEANEAMLRRFESVGFFTIRFG